MSDGADDGCGEAEQSGTGVTRRAHGETIVEEALAAAEKVPRFAAGDDDDKVPKPRVRKAVSAEGLLFERREFHAAFATADRGRRNGGLSTKRKAHQARLTAA